MKKTVWLRIIAFALLSIMLLSVFASCDTENDTEKDTNDNDASEESATNEEVTAEPVPDMDKKNYNDEFYLSIQNACNPMDFYWVEESEGDAMSEAVYARQQKILDYLGVNMIAKNAGGHMEYSGAFKTAVKNKDGSVDTLLTHVSSGVSSMIVEMYLQDLQDIPGIDLEEEYWNHEFMDSLSIADNYYLGYSDYNILYTYVLAFNKKMLNQLALDDYTEESLYKSVNEGTWTLDKLLELGQLGFQEKGDKDIYGIVGMQWVPWCGFLHSSNINLVEMDETGAYKISIMNDANKERTALLVDMLKNYSASGYGSFTFQTGGQMPEAKITNNRALIQLTSTNALESYLDYDLSFGVLPYPMFDTDQYDPNSPSLGYRSLQWGGYIAIPSYLRNDQLVGDTLSLLAFFSGNVKTTFYEKVLGKQVSEAPDDAKMLDIVWESVCSDMGQTFDGEVGILYFLPKVTWPGDGGQELVSYYRSVESAGNKKLAAFIKKVDKLSSKNGN